MRRAIEVLHDVLLGVFFGTLALTWAVGYSNVAFATTNCCQPSADCPTTGCESFGTTCPNCTKCCLTTQ